MTKQEFCKAIADIMEVDDEINETTDLTKYEEFDSLAIMSLVALINSKFGKRIPGTQLKAVKTPEELMRLIGVSSFE